MIKTVLVGVLLLLMYVPALVQPQGISASVYKCKWNGTECVVAEHFCRRNTDAVFGCGVRTAENCTSSVGTCTPADSESGSSTTSNPFDRSQIDAIEEEIPTFKFSASTIGDLFAGDGKIGINAIVFFLAGFALIIYLILGGFQMMTSGGNPDAAAAGKAKITSALIGFVIIFSAYWIVQILGNMLGLEGITTNF